MIKRLYPYGKKKAFNITYDDGIQQDIRFVELLNKYNIKGTFNLNSGLMYQQFEWIHENGMVVKRLPADTVVDLYKNHEVASHTLTHPYMHNMSESEVMQQMQQDKENLEQLFDRKICGFAVPFDFYSNVIADCAQKCGFEYARCSEERFSYTPPENYYWWAASVFHLNPQFEQFVNNFFESKEELALCQIVGHSYDLDAENMWETMENILKRISENSDIISMTNIDIVRYLKAMRSAVITENFIENNTDTKLWFEVNSNIVAVKPYTVFSI
ncbi:MAG: polysaccharide deacetylase family protein [Oscillospiraceae bacterium]|nr:polysaccharide deacetylase family protein [Oscillospiraceae bacterium]